MPLPILGVLVLLSISIQDAVPEHVLFDGRRFERAHFEGPPGNRTPRGLEFQGPGTRPASELELSAGDTGLRLRLALHDRGASGACLRIGESVFGLDGEKNALTLDGPLFGNAFARLDDDTKWFATGKPFELSARRKDGLLVLAIDGRVAYQAQVGTARRGGARTRQGSHRHRTSRARRRRRAAHAGRTR